MSDMRPRSNGSSSIPGIARHGRLRKFGPWRSVFIFIAATLAVALVATLGITAIATARLAGAVKSIDIHPGETIAPPPGIGVYPGGFNILVVGDDTRKDQGGIGLGYGDGGALNDVTILLHVSADHTFATAVSIPRDMIVPFPACAHGGPAGGQPMNVALSYGGLPCAVATVENLTGLKIQFAGLITFRGVIEMADAVGGVPVCVNGPMHDPFTGINLPHAGTYILGGKNALAFLRSRHGVGDGSDLGRISSQQVYLSSLVRVMEGAGTLSNPVTVYKIASAATQNMQLSSSLQSLDALYSIAQTLKNIPPSRVVFVQYPGTTGGTGIFAGKVQPLTAEANQLFALIKSDTPFKLGAQGNNRGSVVAPNQSTGTATPGPTTPPSTGKVAVINGLVGQSAAEVTCSKVRAVHLP